MSVRFEMEKIEDSKQTCAALEKAHSRERKQYKSGYRYIKINDRTKIMVECDADGNPTERGQKVIDAIKRTLQ